MGLQFQYPCTIHHKLSKYENNQESCTYSIEAVVDDMLEILAHSNLFHQLVFVTVHSSKLTNVCKHVLEAIGQLERVHIVQSVLDMTIHNQFRQTKNFTAKMESITESGLFTFFSGQSLHGLQIEVVIQMQIVQVLTMNQQVQHVITLTADLKANFDPIKSGGLEKLGGLE